MTKRKIMYLLLFIVLLVMFHVLFIKYYDQIHFWLTSFLHWNDAFIIMIELILYLTIIILLSLFLSNIIMRNILKLDSVKRKRVLIIFSIAITIVVLIVVSDYRERDLSELIPFDIESKEPIQINEKIKTLTEEEGQAFINLLNQSDAKRITKRHYINMYNELWNGNNYRIVINSKGDTSTFYINEHLLHLENKNKYYKILNGPLDMEWFKEIENE